MQKTITPIDNTVYVEREYHSDKIEETIENSMKAQTDWSNLAVKERVELLNNFVNDFYQKVTLLKRNYVDKLEDQFHKQQVN